MVSSSLTGLHGEMEQALPGPTVQALGVWSPVLESPTQILSEVNNGSWQLYSKMFERPVLRFIFKFILILTQ